MISGAAPSNRFPVMPRQVRIEFPGAYYHVMARGDRREDSYIDDADREMFLETLTTACKRTGWRIHAYVLKKEVR